MSGWHSKQRYGKAWLCYRNDFKTWLSRDHQEFFTLAGQSSVMMTRRCGSLFLQCFDTCGSVTRRTVNTLHHWSSMFLCSGKTQVHLEIVV